MKLPLTKQVSMNEVSVYDDLGNEVIWKANKRYVDTIIKNCNLFPELVARLNELVISIEIADEYEDLKLWDSYKRANELLKKAKL